MLNVIKRFTACACESFYFKKILFGIVFFFFHFVLKRCVRVCWGGGGGVWWGPGGIGGEKI